MSKDKTAFDVLNMVFNNSSELYRSKGKYLVDSFNVKIFIVELMSEYDLVKK